MAWVIRARVMASQSRALESRALLQLTVSAVGEFGEISERERSAVQTAGRVIRPVRIVHHPKRRDSPSQIRGWDRPESCLDRCDGCYHQRVCHPRVS